MISIIYSFSLTACFTNTLATKPVESINSYEDHIRCIAIVQLIKITTPDEKAGKVLREQHKKYIELTKRKFPKKEIKVELDWMREGDRIIRMGQEQLDLLVEQYAKPCNELLK